MECEICGEPLDLGDENCICDQCAEEETCDYDYDREEDDEVDLNG